MWLANASSLVGEDSATFLPRLGALFVQERKNYATRRKNDAKLQLLSAEVVLIEPVSRVSGIPLGRWYLKIRREIHTR